MWLGSVCLGTCPVNVGICRFSLTLLEIPGQAMSRNFPELLPLGGQHLPECQSNLVSHGKSVTQKHSALQGSACSGISSFGALGSCSDVSWQNLGAKMLQRAKEAVWLTARYAVIFMASVTGIYLLFSEEMAGFFTSISTVQFFADQGIWVISFGYVFLHWEWYSPRHLMGREIPGLLLGSMQQCFGFLVFRCYMS